MSSPGRHCPLGYRYRPGDLDRAPDLAARTLYVVGGLYGNLEALAAVRELAACEPEPPAVVFNGDFHWFDTAPERFAAIQQGVAAHIATQGNVEAELADPEPAAGCGCAYPEWVDEDTVTRSNRIMERLAATASGFPAHREELAALPRHLVAGVGGRRVGIVHGDTRSLAGWDLAAERLADPDHRARMAEELERAGVDVLASSHTCRPTARVLGDRVAINNGAAGMPNFRGQPAGLLTRIGTDPPPVASLYGSRCAPLYVDAVPVAYDDPAFRRAFLAAWPEGSPAHTSYWARLSGRVGDTPEHAAGAGFALRPAAATAEGDDHG